MTDFVFFMKLFCLTVAIVLVMQIQVGDRSLESHAMGWVQSSALVGPLNLAAHGGAKMVHDVSNSVHSAIQKNVGKKKRSEKDDEEKSSGSTAHSSSTSFHWMQVHKPEPKPTVDAD